MVKKVDPVRSSLAVTLSPRDPKLPSDHTISGVVLDEHGAPIADAQLDRSSGNFYGEEKVRTDAEGNFTFLNVHGGEDYVVYGIMDTLMHVGAVPEVRITLGKAGSTFDAGAMPVVPARSIKGRVVLSDGGTVPPKRMVLLSQHVVLLFRNWPRADGINPRSNRHRSKERDCSAEATSVAGTPIEHLVSVLSTCSHSLSPNHTIGS